MMSPIVRSRLSMLQPSDFNAVSLTFHTRSMGERNIRPGPRPIGGGEGAKACVGGGEVGSADSARVGVEPSSCWIPARGGRRGPSGDAIGRRSGRTTGRGGGASAVTRGGAGATAGGLVGAGAGGGAGATATGAGGGAVGGGAGVVATTGADGTAAGGALRMAPCTQTPAAATAARPAI